MDEFLRVLMRWVHIGSTASLVGGVLYGAAVLWPSLPPESRTECAGRAAARFRPIAIVAVIGLIISGIYNILIMPGHSPRYHMWLGIKLLLALHVFAVALMVAAGKSRRPARAMTGAAISGFIIIAIAAYLRLIF